MAWEKGSVNEVEVDYRHQSSELTDGDSPDDAFEMDLGAVFVYKDRVEQVEGGQVVRVTRNFIRADVLMGEMQIDTELEGRHVILTRDAAGELTATWNNGAPLSDGARKLIDGTAWPADARAWGAEIGDAQGAFEGLDPGADLPAELAALPRVLRVCISGFPVPISRGSWSIAVEGDHAPLGSVKGELTLEGSGPGDDGRTKQIKARVTSTVTVRPQTSEGFPSSAPPPE